MNERTDEIYDNKDSSNQMTLQDDDSESFYVN